MRRRCKHDWHDLTVNSYGAESNGCLDRLPQKFKAVAKDGYWLWQTRLHRLYKTCRVLWLGVELLCTNFEGFYWLKTSKLLECHKTV